MTSRLRWSYVWNNTLILHKTFLGLVREEKVVNEMAQRRSQNLRVILTIFGLLSLLVKDCVCWPSAPSTSTSFADSRPRLSTTLNAKYNDATSTIVAMPTKTIQNFRQAVGIRNIYRCASTDVLGEKIMVHGENDDEYRAIVDHDRFVLQQVGLILDLRSASEREEVHARVWMNKADVKVVETDQTYKPMEGRCAVRIDVLSPPRLMAYIEKEWLTQSERARALWYKIVDGSSLHEIRIEKLNERGLAGLNEAILETGKDAIFKALTTITEHLEVNPGQSAVIHCVQGKDRTGMLVMLLQSILDVSDLDIIADYFKSNEMVGDTNAGSAAADEMRPRGRLDRKLFSGTNERAMISTLHFLRGKYGSVSPGYLDAIGFDASWRSRLVSVLIPERSKWSSRL